MPTATELKWPEKYPSHHTCYVLRSEGPCRWPRKKQLKIYPKKHTILDQRTEGPRRWSLGKIAQKAIRRTEELWSKVGRSVPMATNFFLPYCSQTNLLARAKGRWSVPMVTAQLVQDAGGTTYVGPCRRSLSFWLKLQTELPTSSAISKDGLRHWEDSKRSHL